MVTELAQAEFEGGSDWLNLLSSFIGGNPSFMLGFRLGLGRWVSGPIGYAGLGFSFSSSFRLGYYGLL
ncbi:hypothetical protein RchiOBHm_Chr1g0369461 [Rosa chinensis]|uniref:Uncharacterized protein n=1 Tax=Rosa chinensis TaxID=74649 RepID=A0A2P6SL34_ROSCH|nr:hypothetical protein RchiOBHm_Chr1g0369461 [Rosa chinensis]